MEFSERLKELRSEKVSRKQSSLPIYISQDLPWQIGRTAWDYRMMSRLNC